MQRIKPDEEEKPAIHRKRHAGDVEKAKVEEKNEASLPLDHKGLGPSEDKDEIDKCMVIALEEARTAFEEGEVPVGCVYVLPGGELIRARNATNVTGNGTRHAELVAADVILAKYPRTIFRYSRLYVTIEPCVMCASALRLLGIGHVTFGCYNERFGGCGSIYSVHDSSVLGLVEGYDFSVASGVRGEDAIALLKFFYAQENPHAPKPKRRNVVVKPLPKSIRMLGRGALVKKKHKEEENDEE